MGPQWRPQFNSSYSRRYAEVPRNRRELTKHKWEKGNSTRSKRVCLDNRYFWWRFHHNLVVEKVLRRRETLIVWRWSLSYGTRSRRLWNNHWIPVTRIPRSTQISSLEETQKVSLLIETTSNLMWKLTNKTRASKSTNKSMIRFKNWPMRASTTKLLVARRQGSSISRGGNTVSARKRSFWIIHTRTCVKKWCSWAKQRSIYPLR